MTLFLFYTGAQVHELLTKLQSVNSSCTRCEILLLIEVEHFCSLLSPPRYQIEESLSLIEKKLINNISFFLIYKNMNDEKYYIFRKSFINFFILFI